MKSGFIPQFCMGRGRCFRLAFVNSDRYIEVFSAERYFQNVELGYPACGPKVLGKVLGRMSALRSFPVIIFLFPN
jgi:hypothetical protein